MREDHRTDRWEPLGGDVVGTASARLLALGVPRGDRLDALRLLGILGAQADAGGVVKRPLSDLAGEFALDPHDAARWLQALTAAGVVDHHAGGMVLAGREPPAAGGLRLADFLANAAAVLHDDMADAEPARDDAPIAWRRAAARGPAAQPAATGRHRHRRVERPLALAGAAAAAVMLVVGLLTAGSGIERADTSDTAASAGRSPSSAPLLLPDGRLVVPAEGQHDAQALRSSPARQSTSGLGTGASIGADPGAPASSQESGPAADGSCPAGPVVQVHTVTAAAGIDPETGLEQWTVTVSGSLANTDGAAAAIESLVASVELAPGPVKALVVGLPEILEGSVHHDWQVTIPVGPTPPELGPAHTDLAWAWADDGVAAACPD